MNFYYGYYVMGMRKLAGCKRWQEVLVDARQGNDERLSALSMLEKCVDAEVFTITSHDMFTDMEAEEEIKSAMKVYNAKAKKEKNCYRFRLANEDELYELQSEHKDNKILLAIVKVDIYGRFNDEDVDWYKSQK